jgi:transcriptional antiterminator RfaH
MSLDTPVAGPAWFCVRTQSKREHIAAGWLKSQLDIDVFVPRIRFRRTQSRGPVWFTEALFPNYLFARFELAALIQHVDFAPGSRGVVRFGIHCPAIPEAVITALQACVGPEQVRTLEDPFLPGETVQLAHGAFLGLQAVVAQVMPARQRVTVLLEFLGRQTALELDSAALTPLEDQRARLFR